ncbi:MAG: PhzF family phenazine biosynthesis protein [Quinella sp. 2Q5]|nr:PhzF family phenazine biosynthesis protein [Quinella sp. 2Q5]
MRQFIADAFTEKIFGGNPAAVCLVESFPPEETMLNIAAENNLSETAFVMRDGEKFRLRWFTPAAEVDLCGHATLATGFVILTQVEKNFPAVTFETLSGALTVTRRAELFEMDFPAYVPKKISVTAEMEDALAAHVVEAYIARDLLMVLDSAAAVESLRPNQSKLAELDGLIQAVTAAGDDCDCVSRVFAPKLAIAEDPVTGSTHCMIAPLWSSKLGRRKIFARQASARGGILHCEVAGDRVKISGNAALFAVAELNV